MLSIRFCSPIKLIIWIAVLLIFVCIPSISPALAEDPLKGYGYQLPDRKKDISKIKTRYKVNDRTGKG